ncbi:nuclear transport factor 2 family protein [Tenacibaculum aiptasiae]|uniref:Nuclear transport factor 2 family protein n=1 Tax=Tenacibaculum aiptasiae TaxID=426481 RepID=A0A7J5AHW4_9FLAO|nr:nuclear transport factor 2 family protein [Tenacibaculum aiptasiae]KAB1157184.1 nuclear transport factor 2 family protein [Tenacibaculum aiptasiae]
MRIFFSSFLILWTLNQAIAQNATKTHKDSLNTIIQKYYDLNLKVFQANSKIEDVDKIFELFSDDFTYIHPKYGGTYTREDLYNGYVRNQKNGGYKGEETAVKIVNKIIGLNAAVVQRSYIINKNGKLKDEEPKMTLFEFKKGKIFRIFEYW